MSSRINPDRLEVANKVLNLILSRERISFSITENRLYISYFDNGVKTRLVRVRSGDCRCFMHRFVTTGGTHERAIVSLAQWIRGKECMDIRVWKKWVSPVFGMKPPEIIDILLEGGFPEISKVGYWD